MSRLVFRVLLPVSAVLVMVLAIAYTSDVPVTDLLRDPSATLDGAWYVGLVSIAGVALWAAAAAICLLCLGAETSPGPRSLLLAGAVTSVILGADDAFLLHEAIKNEIGIPSPLTIGVYGVIALVLFWRAWPYLKNRADLIVFVLGVGLFAVSVILDAAGEADLPTPPYSAVIEDVAKFLGLVTWVTFFAGVGRDLIRRPA
ncbi:MAG: hypothetical protein M3P87_07540 [Actinomycetota bacterium]|nr:hypothetical protein [Actinomycetota bacterium]